MSRSCVLLNPCSELARSAVKVATKDDVDIIDKQLIRLRGVAIDLVIANPDGLDMDNIASCLREAQCKADREFKELYYRLPRTVNGRDVVELFEEGVFGRSQRLTIIFDDIFVRVMPSGAHEISWSWLRDHLIAEVALAGGRSRTKLNAPTSSVKYIQSKELGDQVGKEPDGTLSPQSDGKFENYCPSVIVEVGVSETFTGLTLDKAWWKNFAAQSTRGKLMLIILIDVKKAKRNMSIRLYPTPNFTEDTSRTLHLSFDDPIPGNKQLMFLPEWLYGGEVPDWLQGKSIVADHEALDEWRQVVRDHLFPMSA